MPERSLFLAVFSAVTGCVVLALGVLTLSISTHTRLSTVNVLVLGLMQLGLAAFFFLPDHRRHAKRLMQVVVFLLALVGTSLAVAIIVAD